MVKPRKKTFLYGFIIYFLTSVSHLFRTPLQAVRVDVQTIDLCLAVGFYRPFCYKIPSLWENTINQEETDEETFEIRGIAFILLYAFYTLRMRLQSDAGK